MQGSAVHKRSMMPPEHSAILTRFFAEQPNPNLEQRTTLAKELGMNPRSVQVWFQNRRQRTKPGHVPSTQSKAASALVALLELGSAAKKPKPAQEEQESNKHVDHAAPESESPPTEPPSMTTAAFDPPPLRPTSPTDSACTDEHSSGTASPPPLEQQRHDEVPQQPLPPPCPPRYHPSTMLAATGPLARGVPFFHPQPTPASSPPAVPKKRSAGLDWKQPKVLGAGGMKPTTAAAAAQAAKSLDMSALNCHRPEAAPISQQAPILDKGAPPPAVTGSARYGKLPPPPPGQYNFAWPPLSRGSNPPLMPMRGFEPGFRPAPAAVPPQLRPQEPSQRFPMYMAEPDADELRAAIAAAVSYTHAPVMPRSHYYSATSRAGSSGSYAPS